MGRRKKDDKSKRVDPRKRKTITATIDLGSLDGQLIDAHYKEIKDSSGGLQSWKHFVTNALALFIELKQGNVSSLKALFPHIVDAVSLFLELERGDYSLMKSLFPERYKVFKLQLEADILEGINQDAQKDVLKELRSIKAELADLKASGVSNQAPQSIGGIKQIGTLSVPDPTFDDDDSDLFGIKKDENASQRIANNFLASVNRAGNVKPDPSIKFGRQK